MFLVDISVVGGLRHILYRTEVVIAPESDLDDLAAYYSRLRRSRYEIGFVAITH